MTITVAGARYLQYLPHPTICPFLEAIEMPTTFADAPIGVAEPPISVPMASVHARIDRSTPELAANALITGIMVAAKGMLSTNALAIADSHKMIAIISLGSSPLIP